MEIGSRRSVGAARLVAMNESERRNLDAEVAGCAGSHQTLLSWLDGLVADGTVESSRASLLPGWTVGHVLTHLARNAQALTGMIEGARVGEERVMYRSADARTADIEAGAARSLTEIVDDLRRSVWRLEQAWASLDATGWAGHGIAAMGRLPVVEFPWRRWREVEVHRLDLGLGYTWEHWPTEYVTSDLAHRSAQWLGDPANTLPGEVAAAPDRQRLAWLLGRASGLASPAPSL